MKLESPDSQLSVKIEESSGGILLLAEYKGKSFIECCLEGFETTEGQVGANMKIRSFERISTRENYSLLSGKTSKAVGHFNQIILHGQDKEGNQNYIEVIIRTYNEGFAFCYHLPKLKDRQFEIIRENNQLLFPNPSLTLWPMYLNSFMTNYEELYCQKKVAELEFDRLIAMPLLIETGDMAYAITEAALDDFSGSYLKWNKETSSLKTQLSHLPHDLIAVRKNASFKTPWRVIMVGPNSGKLIESNLLNHLNIPSEIADAEAWVRPGKYAWDWWSGAVMRKNGTKEGMDTETFRHYVDFAHNYHLEYVLIDAGWYGAHDDVNADITQPVEALDLPEIIRYAEERNVGILLWLNWLCVKQQMEIAFPLYHQWGIKGIKMDYMDRDDQEMVRFYLEVARKAGENKLLVNMHGAHKPSGLSRTFPNLLTYEGVRGMEYNKWSSTSPLHHVTIPYTRMLAGPMDFTPGAFRNVKEEKHESRWNEPMAIGTRCSQLAMYVVYESGLQSLCDHPEAYEGQPEADFLRLVPASWDEIKFLAGEVGKFIVLARRKKKQWFIGAMSNSEERFVEVDLSFMKGNVVNAVIYKDIPASKESPEKLDIIQSKISTEGKFMIWMAPAGGMVAIINEEDD